MKIICPAFADHEAIPSKYTCDGENVNPPLIFQNVPKMAMSLVLLMDDPDVPKNLKPDGMFDHWVIYNISPDIKEISENSTPPGTQGLNSVGKQAFYGACPPDREHRYFFKLFALDTTLSFADPTKVTKALVEKQMQGHILDQDTLIGVYKRH